jgi:hypothetical protein
MLGFSSEASPVVAMLRASTLAKGMSTKQTIKGQGHSYISRLDDYSAR